ncbi:MAG TPA: pitrilysin family protein [Pyrinomonadaceae bacterium]|jgi:predicted Zn-dependent peptidase
MTEDFRKTAPAPLAPVPFNISKPFETTLENGLKVVVFEDKRLPIVSFRLAFQVGEANDASDAVGQTSAMVSMLNEGTQNRTSKQLAEEVERLGAHLSASSNSDNTVVAASALSFYSTDILSLMAEIVLKPTFPEGELSLYKQNTIENLKFQRSQPNFLADEQISRILFGEHPYHVASPTPADIDSITREKLIDLHAKRFIPNVATFIVVGNIGKDEILQQIKDIFDGWQKGSVEENEFPAPAERTETTLTIVDRPGSAQSNIVVSNLAINRNNDDYFAFLVMNQVLGAGASSRLFMNLREEKGYTYGAYSSIDARRLAGSFEATSEVRTTVTGDSLKEFFYELNRIRDEKVSEEELTDAKNFLTGVFPIRAETQEGLTNLIVSQQLYNLPEDYLQTYREKINEITLEDVERVAKKYITPEKIAVVIVGDAENVLEQVKSYANTIEIFDTEGNPQNMENYNQDESVEAANVAGKWNLKLEAMGQELAVVLILEQNGNDVSGSLETMLGNGEITYGRVKGNQLTATAVAEVQGQSAEFTISGTVEGDSMSGSLSTQMIPMPLDFTGTREQ